MERDERIGFGLFTNPVRTWGVLDVGLGCGGVCGEWVVFFTRVWRVRWCYGCVRCECGLSV